MAQTCKVKWCDRPIASRGYCAAHYARWYHRKPIKGPVRRYNVTPKVLQPCGVEGCDRDANGARGLCKLHYGRHRKNGDPLVVGTRGVKRIRRELPNITSPTQLAKVLGVSRQRAHQLLNKEAHLARAAVAHALNAGAITKPDACERCSKKTADLEAHHWDYREVLDVRWVCPPCHAIVHPHYPGAREGKQQVTSAAVIA